MSAGVFGRDAELGTLAAFLDGLPAAAGALVLAGPAGAGKTTLLRAGAALAAKHGFTVLQTTPARSDIRLAFAGLTDLLEPCLPAVIEKLAPPQARALRVALLLEDAAPCPPEPRLIAAALRAAVTALAASAPVVLVVDDVQWLDAETEAAVGFTARRLDQEPVGLLCAQRTSRPGADLPLELDRARIQAGLLPVGGLSLGALHRMLHGRLGVSFSRPALRRIEAGSGGNPFIALEIGRALARRGISGSPAAELPVPQTLSELVGERLGGLTPEVIDALRQVAVMPGASAEAYLTAGVDGAALDAAVLAGVLEPEADRLRFSHPLLAAAVAGAIPPVCRRELHAAAARVVHQPEERARHQALASPGRSAQVAAELDAAAGVAAGRGAPGTAAELSGLAAELTPDDQPADAVRRRLRSARQLALAGDTRAATVTLEGLIASLPAGPERADALVQLGELKEDNLEAATALLEQALAETRDDRAHTAEVRLALSHVWLQRGDGGRALAEARMALPDAEAAGAPALLASTLAQVFDLGLMHGDRVDERPLARALELERAGDRLRILTDMPPTWLAGLWHLLQGRTDVAERELRDVLARAEAEGNEIWRADVELRLSQVAVRSGDPAGAAEHAARSLEIAEQLDMAHTTCAALHGCACAALLAGDAEPARAFAVRGATLAGRTADPPYLVLNESVLGSLDLALGDQAAAAARLKVLIGRLPTLGIRPTTQPIWADALEAVVAVGDLDEAAKIVAQFERTVREPVSAALAARCRGIIAAARGDGTAALAEFARALRLHDQVCPMPLERGRTLLALGSLQRRLRQRAAARATLSQAAASFGGVGSGLWARRAHDELERIGGRPPAGENLSVTERRVAELVARGMSNREVAAELFVTVRTVESTLTRTYAKLGVRSRTELAVSLRRLT